MYHTFQFLHHLKMFSLNFMILSLSSFQESNSLFWVLIFLDFVAQWLDPFAQFPLTCLVASSCHKPTFAINPCLFFLYLPSKSYFPISSLWCFLLLGHQWVELDCILPLCHLLPNYTPQIAFLLLFCHGCFCDSSQIIAVCKFHQVPGYFHFQRLMKMLNETLAESK